MRISIILKTSFALFFYCNVIATIQIDGRSESKCGLLGNSIYCFGGYLSASPDASFYSLNVVDFPTNKSMVNLSKGWNLVQPANVDYILEPRRRANAAVFNNQNSFLIVGGYTYNQTTLQNQTIVYHANNNTWETLSNYTDSEGRTSQIFNAAVESLAPNEDSIVFYGGSTENPTFNESGVPTKKDNSSETVMSQGFTSLTAFSSDIKQWLIRSPQTKTPANIMYSSQTATFNPRSNLIYYLGGFFTSKNTSRNATGKADRVGFRTANVFDTKSGAWNTLNLRGQAPRDRVFTTATLMPNSDDILLYGGTNNGNTGASTDFCYTLNLISNEWKPQQIDPVGSNSPPRFAHSAVLVNNSLFIMFGLAAYDNPLDDILVLDVKNVSNLYFPDTYPYIYREPKIILPSSTVNETSTAEDHLSQGQTAGIAVACSVIGLGIIGAAIFFYIRKQKAKKLDEMSVDWDQVENFYTEQPVGGSTQFHENEKFVSMSTLNLPPISPPTRAIKSNPNEYDRDNYTKESSTVVSSEKRLTLVKPSAVGENDQSFVNVSSSPPATMKPDHKPQ